MTGKRLLLVAAAMLCCYGCTAGRPPVKLAREPSIERALDLLGNAPAAAPLIRFLGENPVRFEYANAPCTRYSLKAGVIYLPRALKSRDILLATTLARAAYVHRMYVLSGLEEVISEEEEVAALFQARIGLALGLKESDFGNVKALKRLKSDFCAYIMEGSDAAMLAARASALSVRPECRRPLDTLQTRRVWLEDVRAVIDDNESFFQLMKDRDLADARKGSLTMNEAVKNDAERRSLPTYELYRRQRELYDTQTDIFNKIERLYRSAIKDDGTWRVSNRNLINSAREEFSDCGLPE